MKIVSWSGQKISGGADTSIPLPLWVSKYLYPFGTAEFYKDDFGNYLTQQIATADFTLHFFRLDIAQIVTLYLVTEEPVIALQYMLKGSVHCQLSGYGRKLLEEGTCEMFYLAHAQTEITLTQGIYELCWLELSPGLIAELADKDADIKQLSTMLERAAEKSRPSVSVKINLEVQNVLKEMRTYGYSKKPDKLKVVLDACIYKLLIIYEGNLKTLKHIATIALSRSEEILLQVQQYIIDNADIHECSLGKICSKFHIAEITLRVNFKKQFGVAISHFVTEQCMKRAKVMLYLDKASIASIANELGYDNLSNFNKAFKKFYNCSPVQMRQNS